MASSPSAACRGAGGRAEGRGGQTGPEGWAVDIESLLECFPSLLYTLQASTVLPLVLVQILYI